MIWLLEAAASEAELQPLLPLLEEKRREKIEGFRVERSRVESILAGLLLRYAWDQEYGGPMPSIEAAKRGKPVFSGESGPHFNLSHWSRRDTPDLSAKTVVACAMSQQPVGVDVQGLHHYDGRLRRVLSKQEIAWIEAGDRDERFTALWTRKEAYGKALGCGIGYQMEQTDFSGDFDMPTPYEGRLLWTVPRAGYFLSVCAGEALQLRTLRWPERNNARSGGSL